MRGGCLSDRALTRAHLDDATPATHAHLVACAACAGRYARLLRDLDTIAGVLRDPPPLPSRHRRAAGRPVLALASAVALLVIVATTAWTLRTSREAAPGDETLALVGEVSATMFPAGGDGFPADTPAGPAPRLLGDAGGCAEGEGDVVPSDCDTEDDVETVLGPALDVVFD